MDYEEQKAKHKYKTRKSGLETSCDGAVQGLAAGNDHAQRRQRRQRGCECVCLRMCMCLRAALSAVFALCFAFGPRPHSVEHQPQQRGHQHQPRHAVAMQNGVEIRRRRQHCGKNNTQGLTNKKHDKKPTNDNKYAMKTNNRRRPDCGTITHGRPATSGVQICAKLSTKESGAVNAKTSSAAHGNARSIHCSRFTRPLTQQWTMRHREAQIQRHRERGDRERSLFAAAHALRNAG